jgi:hypothetical protein
MRWPFVILIFPGLVPRRRRVALEGARTQANGPPATLILLFLQIRHRSANMADYVRPNLGTVRLGSNSSRFPRSRLNPLERKPLPIACAHDHGHHLRLCRRVPLQRQVHLALIAIIQSDEIRSHEEQVLGRQLKPVVDLVLPLVSWKDFSVVPNCS